MRVIAAGIIFWAIDHGYFGGASVLFAFAGVTDWIDGRLARYMKEESVFGALFDPLADKILMTSTLVALWMKHQAPIWFVGVVIGRDILILSGFAILRWSGRATATDFPPTRRGKQSTVWQIAAIVLLLFFAIFPDSFSLGVWCVGVMIISLGYTAASGLDYFRRGLKLFHRPHLSFAVSRRH